MKTVKKNQAGTGIIRFLLPVVLIGLCIIACKPSNDYPVATVKNERITIDGCAMEPAWNKAVPLGSFSNPWNSICPETSLRLLHDDKYLYFFFEAEDSDLLLSPVFTGKLDVGKEDRVELFFSKDKEMNEYYCFEIDPQGRILSYKCSYYRNYEYDWNVPEEMLVKGRIHERGYSVEGAIPLTFLLDFVQADGYIYSGSGVIGENPFWYFYAKSYFEVLKKTPAGVGQRLFRALHDVCNGRYTMMKK